MQDERVRQDLEAIERLHRADREAVVSGDLDRLPGLVCSDAVMMPPGVDFQRGGGPTPEAIEAWKRAYLDYAEVEYDFDFEEVLPLGDHAVEWGTLSSRVLKTDGTEERERFKLMRVLRRDDDGEWRVWRAIWNEAPAAGSSAVADASLDDPGSPSRVEPEPDPRGRG